MTRIIVLLNLKPGKAAADYERWALATDLPTVNALASVDGFTLHRATGVLGGGESPYQYVEIIDVADMGRFGEEAASATMAAIAAEFQEWADPTFIVTDQVGAAA